MRGRPPPHNRRRWRLACRCWSRASCEVRKIHWLFPKGPLDHCMYEAARLARHLTAHDLHAVRNTNACAGPYSLKSFSTGSLLPSLRALQRTSVRSAASNDAPPGLVCSPMTQLVALPGDRRGLVLTSLVVLLLQASRCRSCASTSCRTSPASM